MYDSVIKKSGKIEHTIKIKEEWVSVENVKKYF